ncbi:MAG: hypothetical protein CME06_15800 [Gemmatimonadetes bacterium]|nr:hypothetical protein [Gemmatimonadota bacterium]
MMAKPILNPIPWIGALTLVGTAFASVTLVPMEQPTLAAAIESSAPGDTIAIAGSVRESVVIDARRVEALVLTAAGESLATIRPAFGDATILTIDNRAARPFELRLERLDFRGRAGESIGIELIDGGSPEDGAATTIDLIECSFSSLLTGVKLGAGAGARACDPRWTAIDPSKLDRARSLIRVSRSAFVNLSGNGLELHRSEGRIDHSLFALCGTEGIHTTAAHRLHVERNLFIRSHKAQLHLQMPGDVSVRNNLFAGAFSIEHPIGLGRIGGHGLVIDGGGDRGTVSISNNVFVANEGTGLRIAPSELFLPNEDCRTVPVRAEVRDNIFHMNGSDDAHRERWAIYSRDGDLPGFQVEITHNLLQQDSALSNVDLDATNLLGRNPLFVDAPRDLLHFEGGMGARRAWATAFEAIRGFSLRENSPALGSGEGQGDMGILGNDW